MRRATDKAVATYVDANLRHGANAELHRLRAAMVHAMDDCEHLSGFPSMGFRERDALRRIGASLKSALEKK